MKKIRIHAFVFGRVQGVFFRFHTKEIAEELGLKGWVKNLFDGRVEVLVEGEKDKVEKLVQFLKNGPPAARVEKVEIKEEKYRGEFKNFSIIY
jgi:acylphosphatase